MGVRGIWLHLGSFLVAVLMLWYAAFSVLEYCQDKNRSFVGTALAVGLFLVVAGVYVFISLRLGKLQKRRLHMNKKKEAGKGDSQGS